MMKVGVIGAGPAGMSAAIYLCSEGADVTVIERFSESAYDRYHSICGAGIGRDVFRRLKYVEPVCVRNNVDSAVLHFPGGTDVSMPVKGYVLDRPAFLKHHLRICAEKGCKFIHGEAEDVILSDGNPCILLNDGTSVNCDRLIACDGASSLIRKRVFKSRPRYVTPAEEFVIDGPSEPVFHMYLEGDISGAYKWNFPSGNLCNVGSVSGRFRPDTYISNGTRTIPTGGVPVYEKQGITLAGDSGGMANPICYGGLRSALLAGQEAARCALSGREGNFTKWWMRSRMSDPRFSRMRD